MTSDKDDIVNNDIEDSDLERIDFLACLLKNLHQHPSTKRESVVLSSEVLEDLNTALFGIEE
jgi:hypothetical protein